MLRQFKQRTDPKAARLMICAISGSALDHGGMESLHEQEAALMDTSQIIDALKASVQEELKLKLESCVDLFVNRFQPRTAANMVWWCMLKRVESALCHILKLKYVGTAFKRCSQFQLAPL